MNYFASYKMLKTMGLWIKACGIALKRLFQENYTYRASALAFTTLLTIVPLLAVIVSLIAIFPIFNQLINLAQNYIIENFVPTSGTTIQLYLEGFIKQATHLPKLGIIFLFFTVITLIVTVEHTLNEIWGAKQRKKKISAILLYWLVLILTPLFLGLSVLLSSYIFSLSWIAGATSKLGINVLILSSLPLAINTLLFSVLYIAVPNCRVEWQEGLVGGFIAAVLYELAKKGFAFYVLQFPSYEIIYGTLATIPIFLLWIYISWLIILYGALVTHAKFQLSNKTKN